MNEASGKWRGWIVSFRQASMRLHGKRQERLSGIDPSERVGNGEFDRLRHSAEFLEARALLTENPASQMFTALNEEVAAGFKLGNDDIKAGYDAVKDVPTTFRNQFSNSKSWVNELPTITETGSSLNSSIIINFPTMTLEGPSFSSPTASAPTFGAGQAYPFYSGSHTAPYYSIYGSTGHASYNTATGVGQRMAIRISPPCR